MSQLTQRLRARVSRLVGSEPPVTVAPPWADVTPRVFPALSEHTRRYMDRLGPQDLTPYEFRVFSQNGEDGIISEILSRIGIGPRWFVEFGIGSGHQGNCVLLADVYRWNGLFCELDQQAFEKLAAKYQHNPRVKTDCVAITPDNVEAVFERHQVDLELDVLSIDVDTIDFWIWKAIDRFRPRLVIVEYNASLSPDRAQVFPNDPSARWDETSYYGSSLGAFRLLGRQKGYDLVHTDLLGINAFFVRRDLADRVGITAPPIRALNFGLTGGSMPVDPLGRAWVEVPEGDSG